MSTHCHTCSHMHSITQNTHRLCSHTFIHIHTYICKHNLHSTHLHTHPHTCAYTVTHPHSSTFSHSHVLTYTHSRTPTHSCIHTCSLASHIHSYVFTRSHRHTGSHTQSHTDTRIYSHTHIHIRKSVLPPPSWPLMPEGEGRLPREGGPGGREEHRPLLPGHGSLPEQA